VCRGCFFFVGKKGKEERNFLVFQCAGKKRKKKGIQAALGHPTLTCDKKKEGEGYSEKRKGKKGGVNSV